MLDLGREEDGREDRDSGGGPRIRCPKCDWEPRASSTWSCRCATVWNTFDTGGVCPGCDFRWRETQCLSCFSWSPHADWYVDDDEG